MIDLHLHLDGSIDPGDMPRLAELSGPELPSTGEEELRSLLSVEHFSQNSQSAVDNYFFNFSVLHNKPLCFPHPMKTP